MRLWMLQSLACIALAPVVAVVGCGSDPKPKKNPPVVTNPTTTPTTTPTTNPTTTPTNNTTEPNIDTISWQSVGLGVASKDTKNTKGSNVALIYAGFDTLEGSRISLDAAEAWATALYKADLRDRGVKYLYAIQGPAAANYGGQEIENTAVVRALNNNQVTSSTRFVLVIAHANGSHAAHELLRQLENDDDANNKVDNKIVYFNLDGFSAGYNSTVANFVKKAYFVSPRDADTDTFGLNNNQAQTFVNYGNSGSILTFDAAAANCDDGAPGCVQSTLLTSKPHSLSRDESSPDEDYNDFSGRSVTTRYITDKSSEAGLSSN